MISLIVTCELISLITTIPFANNIYTAFSPSETCRGYNKLGAGLEDFNCLRDHLVHDLCGRLDLINDSSTLAQQVGPSACTKGVVVGASVNLIFWNGVRSA